MVINLKKQNLWNTNGYLWKFFLHVRQLSTAVLFSAS